MTRSEARKPSVVLFEPDRTIAEMYVLGLTDLGLATDYATTIPDALALITGNLPDFIVITWEKLIPGDELLAVLRSDSATQDVPVFMFSQHPAKFADQAIVRAVFKAGALDWLVKSSTTPAELARRITAALQDKAAGA